jgi:hypothetical protein
MMAQQSKLVDELDGEIAALAPPEEQEVLVKQPRLYSVPYPLLVYNQNSRAGAYFLVIFCSILLMKSWISKA